MKKYRVLSLLAVLALVFTAFGCTVFASEVSSSDTSEVVSPTDYLSDFQLSELKIDQHRFSMLVPQLKGSFSANSTNADLSIALPSSGLSMEDIINYNDSYYSGNILSYLFSASSDNSGVMVNVVYTSNNYTKFISDYNDIDEATLEDIRTSIYTYSGTFPELRTINGNIFLYAEGYDADYGYYSYSMETIVGGGRYQVYVDLKDPSSVDKEMVAQMVESIKIGGFKATLFGAADKTLVNVLLIVVIVLAVIVALLTFFIIRFSLFASAAGSKFNIIGFSMPPSKAEIEAMRKKQKKSQKKGTQNTTSIVDSISDID